MRITNLCFADDLLLFARGDVGSVSSLLDSFNAFLKFVVLCANHTKCFIYYGSVESNVQDQLVHLTGYKEGKMPFRYLGIHLSSKKHNIKHYQILIDKIVGRITHWSARILSFAGRIQLIQSVLFATVNFWMQCLPLPKVVIMKINTICRSFLWTGDKISSNKSPIAWDKVCSPKKNGGLNIINLGIWNKISILRLLWNVCLKSDNLWIKWLHVYYIKDLSIWTMPVKDSYSWILNCLLHLRPLLLQHQGRIQNRFRIREAYLAMFDNCEKVFWRNLIYHNTARPHATFSLWQACHCRLASKDRLIKIGVNLDPKCVWCPSIETHDHLFFGCAVLKKIWSHVLTWLLINHVPAEWTIELPWIVRNCKGKGWRAMLLKCAFTETVYHV